MSATETLWIKIAEKSFGLLLLGLSLLMIYFTVTSTNVLNAYSGFFAFLSVIPLIAGVLLIIAKPPE
ncbi:MAG: hypothetical protein N3D85_07735 [Candidatus Bathyarchaeota archaeon]|nr:hypothetical protein [Candidatus Bathyarchaeota archaeon]